MQFASEPIILGGVFYFFETLIDDLMHLIGLHSIHDPQTANPLNNHSHNFLQINPTQTFHNILHKKQQNPILNHIIFLPRTKQHIQ
jgi:hypothetical protein